MISAGIDQSLTGTAVCILDFSSLKKFNILHVETIVTKPTMPHLKRLRHIVDSVYKSLEKSKLDAISIEGYSFGSKGRAVFDLAELGGLLRMMIAETYGGYHEVAPTVLKKYITGKGSAKKEVMLEQVFRKFGIGSEILTDNNQIDAFSLAIYTGEHISAMTKVTL